jgi:regulator of RNase E activity RraA
VRVGGLTIHPGDLIHADTNGVTAIPLDIAADVPQVAGELATAEAVVLDYLRSGKPDPKGFAQARQAMMAEFAAISKRVRRDRAVGAD